MCIAESKRVDGCRFEETWRWLRKIEKYFPLTIPKVWTLHEVVRLTLLPCVLQSTAPKRYRLTLQLPRWYAKPKKHTFVSRWKNIYRASLACTTNISVELSNEIVSSICNFDWCLVEAQYKFLRCAELPKLWRRCFSLEMKRCNKNLVVHTIRMVATDVNTTWSNDPSTAESHISPMNHLSFPLEPKTISILCRVVELEASKWRSRAIG